MKYLQHCRIKETTTEQTNTSDPRLSPIVNPSPSPNKGKGKVRGRMFTIQVYLSSSPYIP